MLLNRVEYEKLGRADHSFRTVEDQRGPAFTVGRVGQSFDSDVQLTTLICMHILNFVLTEFIPNRKP